MLPSAMVRSRHHANFINAWHKTGQPHVYTYVCPCRSAWVQAASEWLNNHNLFWTFDRHYAKLYSVDIIDSNVYLMFKLAFDTTLDQPCRCHC